MKTISGTIKRFENGCNLAYTQIQCDCCGRVREIKGKPETKKVQQALAQSCRTCNPATKSTGSRGWWTQFGLDKNPYVYGPMPHKRTAEQYRIIEARIRGWVSWMWDDEYKQSRRIMKY